MVMAIVPLVQTGMTSKIAAVAPIPVEKVKEIVMMTMNAVAISSVDKIKGRMIIIVQPILIRFGIQRLTAVTTLIFLVSKSVVFRGKQHSHF